MNDAKTPVIAAVVPCYKVERHLARVLTSVPPAVRHIIVVDDACPNGSGKIAEALQSKDERIVTLFHPTNKGVGGAVITGYKHALSLASDIVVKIDGDGQMDPAEVPRLVEPLVAGRADYAKGNRFRNFDELRQMPRLRLVGNSFLSFFLKAASGYWNLMDPANGYTAIQRQTLQRLDLGRISEGYFFESDMLIRLSLVNAVVEDVPIPTRYGDEISSLRISGALVRFPLKLLRGLMKRILLQYFVYDFNMASVYILIGLPLFLFGVIFGVMEWVDSIMTGISRPAGTIMLSALPVILGFQMLLQAVQIDINRILKKSKS